ncbi:TetR/AcrR family transcriptional regulator [Kineosporia rhizophila]|uniref:TetR/AcrR family transcriptional regulator n=1 Tax=Kineosporia TaxID=49184 RepID=UPI001E4E044E|nr:TetR/AcrR family transcriptional regulator [Kineosporia sp. NBRC 101677]MCE0535929.1 TetR/AcrR family transcriptional regulator [Kineosporia rhizophila]
MSSSTATRDRILDAAMQLFSEHGFRGTSVAAIERAAGLTPGAGGLYHHFRTKEAVLSEALERHLGRLGALRDIRRLFAGVQDLEVELTLIARYVLAELEAESELVQVLTIEGRARPDLVGQTVQRLVGSSVEEFTAWLVQDWGVPEEQARPIAAIALPSLFSHRLVCPSLLGTDEFVAAWVGTFGRALTQPS